MKFPTFSILIQVAHIALTKENKSLWLNKKQNERLSPTMYILIWYIPDSVGLTVIVLLAYLFFVGAIRSGLNKLQNPEVITKCMRLPKSLKYLLFLPLPFRREDEVFPIYAVVLTALVHAGSIILILEILFWDVIATHFMLPDWMNGIGGRAATIVLLSWILEMFLLGSDESSQKPPKLPKR